MGERVLNWGILGCAHIAETRFIPGLLKAGNAKLYAVSSRQKGGKLDRFVENFHPAVAYGSYEELLDDPAVDAVYIPLPNGLHAEWAVKALEKHKHVLCEKPLGSTVEEVRRMHKAAEENGRLLMEAFAYRHSPLTKKVKELVDDGAVGRLRFINSVYSFSLTDPESAKLSPDLAGGALYDIGCYNLNVARYIAGAEPESIEAIGHVGGMNVDLDDCVVLKFPGELIASCYSSFAADRCCFYTVIGDKGVLTVPYEFNAAGKVGITVKTAGAERTIEIDCPDNYMLEAEQFGRAVLDGETPLVGAGESLGNARVIDEALHEIFAAR